METRKKSIHSINYSNVIVRYTLLLLSAAMPISSYAWFFILPIPNFAKPPALEKIIQALENSKETKAIAYVSEDKTFGTKYWVWGHHTNGATQQITEQIALQRCEASLQTAKQQKEGGQPLYDYGQKKCELHAFQNPYVPPPTPQVTPTAPSPQSTSIPQQQQQQQDIETRLQGLKSLLDKGLLTKEEYEQKRQDILKAL